MKPGRSEVARGLTAAVCSMPTGIARETADPVCRFTWFRGQRQRTVVGKPFDLVLCGVNAATKTRH